MRLCFCLSRSCFHSEIRAVYLALVLTCYETFTVLLNKIGRLDKIEQDDCSSIQKSVKETHFIIS